MLRSADRGATLRDGAWVAVSGRIDSSSPLRAPMSGEEVIAYEYKVERWEKVIRGQARLPWFDGKALAPSVIRTPHGPVRLLTVPRLEGERAGISSSQAIPRTSAYLRATTFEKRDTAREREWADDYGSFRIDRRHSETDPDLSVSLHARSRSFSGPFDRLAPRSR